jgi:hypothetical protein
MNMVLSLPIPKRIWIEMHDAVESDACDVIVELESGVYYTAPFVTLPYLERQMSLSYEVSKTLPDALPTHYAALETPHIIVKDLCRETIEDTLDNLIALDTFESIFTQVTDEEGNEHAAAIRSSKRATAEVAAVVLNEVLMVEGDTTVA